VTLGAFDGPDLIAKASGRVEWLALRAVVDRVYTLRDGHLADGMDPQLAASSL